MYSLDVNFLKNRAGGDSSSIDLQKDKTYQKSDSQAPLLVGLSVMVLLPAVAGGYLWMVNQQQNQLNSEIQDLEGKINQIRGENRNISQIQEQVKKIQQESQALVSVFNQIKPWSAVLQDIRDRIPQGVQINSITENSTTASAGGRGQQNATNSSGKIELSIKGIARSHDDVNDFLLTLKDSQFLNSAKTFLETTKLVNNPIVLELPEKSKSGKDIGVELPKVVDYSIKTEMNDIPASELLQELSSKGAVGLVTRIKTLEGKGAIEQ